MKINGLMMDVTDNVVTCMSEVKAGETVVFRKGEELCTLTALENIPYCHKIASRCIKKGESAVKYGESLGEVSQDIAAGHLVADHNLFSVPRNYDSELADESFVMCAKQSQGAPEMKGFQFWGYRRA